MTGRSPLGFGTWLRLRRTALDLSQAQLARRVGCAAITIRKIEAEERRPSPPMAQRLAEVLGVASEERASFVRYARGDPWAGQSLAQDPAQVTPWRIPSSSTRRGRWPAPLTRLIGREAEVADVCARLLDGAGRLLSLTGPAGVGKTRLALEAATSLASPTAFPDGVFFVPLASIADPALLLASLVRALEMKAASGRPLMEQLQAHLSDRRALLVLDNFEQIVEAAPLVVELLSACAGLVGLVTSREALGAYGERQYRVRPLALPSLEQLPPVEALPAYGAVALFTEFAQAVQPDFGLTRANAAAVAAICVRLDGLPLALELVAARMQLLPPQALLARLGGPLVLAAEGLRGHTARHRTLDQAIGWSYDLLRPPERRLFERLAVFAGGFTLEAAEAVAGQPGDTPDMVAVGVASLLNKSLVQHDVGHGTAQTEQARFSMLVTIKDYAAARLAASGDENGCRRRHTDYFLAVAEAAEPELRGPQQVAWLERLDHEMDNLRAALRWALDHGQVETALRLGGALWRFWYAYSHLYLVEGHDWLQQALKLAETAGATEPSRAKALNGAGILAWALGDHAQAERWLAAALGLQRQLGDKAGVAAALNNLGNVAREQSDYARARALHAESLALKRELGNLHDVAISLGNLGLIAHDQGDCPGAIALYEESLGLYRQLGDPFGTAVTLNNLGGALLDVGADPAEATAVLEECLALSRVPGASPFLTPRALTHLGRAALQQGHLEQAEDQLNEALALDRQAKSKTGIATALFFLGQLALRRDDGATARTLAVESLTLRRDLGGATWMVESLELLAEVDGAVGRWARAVVLLAAAEALRSAIGVAMTSVAGRHHNEVLAEVRPHLSTADFEEARAAGQAMTLTAAVEYALSG